MCNAGPAGGKDHSGGSQRVLAAHSSSQMGWLEGVLACRTCSRNGLPMSVLGVTITEEAAQGLEMPGRRNGSPRASPGIVVPAGRYGDAKRS